LWQRCTWAALQDGERHGARDQSRGRRRQAGREKDYRPCTSTTSKPAQRGSTSQSREPGRQHRSLQYARPRCKTAKPSAGGVVVTKVDPDGIAAERGLQAGDIILDVAGNPVSAPLDVQRALNDAHSRSKRNVVARVKSGYATRFIAIPV